LKPKHISNIIVGPAYPLRGGIAAHNQSLSYHLNQLGHPSSVISYSMQYPNLLFPGKTQYDESKPSELIQNLDISAKLNSLNPFSWYTVSKQINILQPQLLILRFWMPYFGMALGSIGRLVNHSNTKIIGLVDNAIPHEPRKGDAALTKYFLKICDGCMVMSQSVRDDILQFNTNKKVALSPHPVYDHYKDKIEPAKARKLLGLNPQGRYLLFFGMIRKYKGLDLLLDAFHQVHKNDPNIQLIIAGEYYEDESVYQNKIKEYGLTENIVSINKYIPDEEVHLYFSAADLITQTYHTATQSGISQIAYHYEKPMLVTDVGGLKEIVPHQKAGYVVEKNAETIATSIIDFFENDRAKDFLPHLKEEKKKYSWSNFVQELIALSHQL